MEVTPFDVNAVDGQCLDYQAVIRQFGCTEMTEELLKQTEDIIQVPLHTVMQRTVCSHRGFDELLKHHTSGGKWYIYTGRGPSSSGLHLGHLVPMTLAAWLQRCFNVPVVIQLTDDEKFLFKDGLKLSEIDKMAHSNIGDILACRFDPDKTFVFRNTRYIQHLYPTVLQIQKLVSTHISQATFGFDGQSNIGQVAFPAIQAAPSFAETFRPIFGNDFDPKKVRCLIPCAIDQDPYFRLTREVARKLKLPRPCLLHTTFLASMQSLNTKMSSSKPETAIFLTDTEKQIRKKINKSFSGGQELLEDHRRLGGDPNMDVSCGLLRVFEIDDVTLTTAEEGFRKGTITCGEIKKLAADVVVNVVKEFKEAREEIKDRDIEAAQAIRPIDFGVSASFPRPDPPEWSRRWENTACHQCDPVWRCLVCATCLRCDDKTYHKFSRVCTQCRGEGWHTCAKHGNLGNDDKREFCRWCMM